MKYLISAFSMREAAEIARSRNLKPVECVYIPMIYEKARRQKLDGQRADKEHLIGHFSNEEIAILTAWEGKHE